MFKIKEKKTKEDVQIELGFKYSRLNFFYKFKKIIQKIEDKYELLPFWKNGFTWLLVFVIAFNVIFSLVSIIKDFNQLPPSIPFMYNAQTGTWSLIPKIFIICFPVLVLLIGYLLFEFIKSIFFINRRVAVFISIGTIVCNILALIAFLEIILLITR